MRKAENDLRAANSLPPAPGECHLLAISRLSLLTLITVDAPVARMTSDNSLFGATGCQVVAVLSKMEADIVNSCRSCGANDERQ